MAMPELMQLDTDSETFKIWLKKYALPCRKIKSILCKTPKHTKFLATEMLNRRISQGSQIAVISTAILKQLDLKQAYLNFKPPK